MRSGIHLLPKHYLKPHRKENLMKGKADTILVSFDYTHGDIPVLIVGRKDKGEIDIINAFKGDEAKELYQKLTMKKGVGSVLLLINAIINEWKLWHIYPNRK